MLVVLHFALCKLDKIKYKSRKLKQTLCSAMESSQLSLWNCTFKHKNTQNQRRKQEDGQRSLSPGGGVCRGWLMVQPEIHESWISLRWAYRGACESRQKGKRGGGGKAFSITTWWWSIISRTELEINSEVKCWGHADLEHILDIYANINPTIWLWIPNLTEK